jgi:hypothetical protein
MINFDCSTRSPTSSIPQSNGNDVGDGDNSMGYYDKGGRQAMATMTMVMATTWAMVTAMRWRETKRAMKRAAMVMAMATRVAGNKVGDGEGRKSNGDGNKEGEGKGEGGKSNNGGNKEGNNMGDAYGNEGGGGAMVATMVMVTK